MKNMTKQQIKASRDFVKELRVYFSSLSARGAKYLFLNVGNIPNSFVITNGDYEMLTGYVPVMTSIHLVTFLDPTFYNQFLEFLNLKIDKPYIIRISQLLKAFKDNGAHELDVVYDQFNNMKVVVNSRVLTGDEHEVPNTESDESEEVEESIEDNPFKDNSKFETITFKSADICGQVVDNFHALHVLEDVVLDMNQKKTFLIQENTPHKEIDLSPDLAVVHSNYYRIRLDIDDLINKETHEVYSILMDGLDIPSLREFVGKRDHKKLTLLVWCTPMGSIQHMAMYNDSTLSVKSTRPFLAIFPIPKEKMR